MNDDLTDEIEALNAIYDSECLVPSSSPDDSSSNVYILQPPTSVVSPPLKLRLRIPTDYPTTRPTILETGSTGAALAEEVLEQVWREGEVCLYDLVEGLHEVLGGEEPIPTPPRAPSPPSPQPSRPLTSPPPPSSELENLRLSSPEPPAQEDPWIIAPTITEKKSAFIARAITVTSADEAQTYIARLLTDKKLAKATHNITAFRIVKDNGVVVQDNDDDGETAAGSRLAHLLQVMDVKDVCVVVSRWFGGVKLGPDRFRLINTAAREALVLGGFVKEPEPKEKGKGKKKR